MMKQNTSRLLQSGSAYGSASLITLTLHEFAHGIVATLFGLHPTVYGLHEEDIATSHTVLGVIAGAGPVASLLLGILFLSIHRRQRGQSFGRYLTLWLGLLGIATFFGYLMTAPFFHAGDVYKVLSSLGITSPLFTWLSFLIGASGIVQLGRITLPYLLNLTNRDNPLRPQMFALGFMAWLIGGGTVLLVTLPAFSYMLMLVGAFVPLTNFFAAKRDKTKPYGEPGAGPSVPYVGVGLLIILALLEQTVLRRGVRL